MNLVISVEEYPKYQMFQLTKPQTSENRLRLDAGLKILLSDLTNPLNN